MKIISVINQKGGVGKSTITVNVSYECARQGKKVLVIDLDPQAHSSIPLGKMRAEFSIVDVLSDRQFDIEKAIYPAQVDDNPIENLFIIPSGIRLAAAAERMIARNHREKILEIALKKVKDRFDFIFIDCPPTLGVLAVNGVYVADEFIIPVTPSRQALDGVADLFGVIQEIKESENFRYQIVRSMFDQRTSKSIGFIEEELSIFGSNIADTIIRRYEAVNQAYMAEKPLSLHEPFGNAAKDFQELTREVLNGQ